MNLSEALDAAARILEEEQVQPTLGYRYVSHAWPRNQLYQQHQLQQQVAGAKLRLGMTKADVVEKLSGAPITKVNENYWMVAASGNLGPSIHERTPQLRRTLLDYLRQ